jgi:hypothetical protein
MEQLLLFEGKIIHAIMRFCIFLLFSWFDPKFKLFCLVLQHLKIYGTGTFTFAPELRATSAS